MPGPPLQVKTIDTPRVRNVPQTEIKKRQAALEAYRAAEKQGEPGGCRPPAAQRAAAPQPAARRALLRRRQMLTCRCRPPVPRPAGNAKAAAEAIDALCGGESSSEEDISGAWHEELTWRRGAHMGSPTLRCMRPHASLPAAGADPAWPRLPARRRPLLQMRLTSNATSTWRWRSGLATRLCWVSEEGACCPCCACVAGLGVPCQARRGAVSGM